MAAKAWKIVIFETDGSTPDITITDAELLAAPRIGGQRIYPLDCRAETLGWSVEVGDFSDFITADMTDGSANINLTGRLAKAQIDTGSGFSTVWTGYVRSLSESEGPGKWAVHFTGSRLKELGTLIYETTTTALFMPSDTPAATVPAPLADWFDETGVGTPAMDVEVQALDGDYIRLELINPVSDAHNKRRWEVLKQDIAAGGGVEFDTECFVDGATRPVTLISENLYAEGTDPDTTLDTDGEEMTIRYFWVYYPDPGQPEVMDAFSDFRFQPAVLPVSEAFPHHVGGSSATGKDPATEIKDRYDDAGRDYDSDTFSAYNATTNPFGLVSHPDIPVMWELHKEPVLLEEWTAGIYAALKLIPVEDGDGKIRPRHSYPPTTDGLTVYTDADLAQPATFEHRGDEAVTVVTASTTRITADGYPNLEEVDILLEISATPEQGYEHANASVVRETHHIHQPFLSDAWFEDRVDIVARADIIFDRWAYGPIWLDIIGMDSLSALQPGDWAKFVLSNYPSHISETRDATPFVAQVMEKRQDPAGPRLRLMMAGNDYQPYAS